MASALCGYGSFSSPVSGFVKCMMLSDHIIFYPDSGIEWLRQYDGLQWCVIVPDRQ